MNTCAAAGCTNPVPATGRPGRPALYCTPACRPSRKPGNRRRPPALTVDLVDTNNDTDPPGRNPHSWAVRLRRGPATVTVADHLGRFTATALAGDLQHLIHPEGGTTD
jgi:hypothetical protein